MTNTQPQLPARRAAVTLLTTIGTWALVLALGGCQQSGGNAAMAEAGSGQVHTSSSDAALLVFETHIVRAATPPTRSVLGKLEPGLALTLSSQTQALVAEILYEEGDMVTSKRGDVVLRLDPDPFDIQVQRSQALLNQAQARLDLAVAKRVRTEALHESGSVDRDALDQALASEREAQAAISATEADLRDAHRARRLSEIRVPLGMRIVKIHVERRELAIPGSPLIEAVDIRTLEAHFEVPSHDLPLVAKGKRLELLIKELPGRTFEGRVEVVSPVASDTTRRFNVVLGLSNPNEALRPGLAAVLQLGRPSGSATDSPPLVRVPRRAVVERYRMPSCLLVEVEDGGSTGVVRRRQLSRSPDPTAHDRDNLTVAGILPGATVVLGPGLEALEDGERIRLARETTTGNER